jgi:predicted secreted Zn-dependent protease
MRGTFQIERLNKPLNRTTPMNKSTGHPESGRAALDVKAKKNKSEAEASLMRD